MDDDRRSSENNGEVEVVRERLQRTIDALFEDAARAELWACALNGFAQAVPDYSNPSMLRRKTLARAEKHARDHAVPM